MILGDGLASYPGNKPYTKSSSLGVSFVGFFQHQISFSTRKRDGVVALTAILLAITLAMMTTQL